MKRVCVIGHFGFGQELLNGQTIKTKIITKELDRRIGDLNVSKIDTRGGKTAYLKLPFQIVYSLITSENVVILPAHNGVRVLPPLLRGMNILFRRKLHYIVIGGWLPELLKNKVFLKKCLKKFSGIYVETSTLKRALESQGFKNVFVMPNSKDIKILKEEELVYSECEPLRLCTFSRVMREKGIENAIEAVEHVNEVYDRTVFHLDIYGPIEEGQERWFRTLCDSFPNFVKYCGKVNYDNTTYFIKNYYALLFPTNFYTEGIPGTIIDAYAAGVPVISSEWESFSDVIDNNITGIGYSFNEQTELESILHRLAERPYILNELKPNCLLRAKGFMISNTIESLLQNIK